MIIENRLDKFQSHSVHYVLLACRSTEDIRSFTEGTEDTTPATSLAAIDAASQLGDEIKGANGGSAFLVMDTRRFSQFTIENFSVETNISGFGIQGGSSPHATAMDMSFTVIDPVGISFANFLQYIMDEKLQVSYDGMTLLLRVLFVGHAPVSDTNFSASVSGTNMEVVQSVTIPCIFNSIEVQLTESRGTYVCKLFPLLGMASNRNNNPRWTSIGNATTYFTGQSTNTLGDLVNSFERNLNAEAIKRYTQLNAEAQRVGAGTKTLAGRYGRPIQYMITLPKAWETFTFAGPAVGAATEINFAQLIADETQVRKTAAEQQRRQQQNNTAPAQDSHISVAPDWTVTEVLDKIFSQTLQVQQLANFSKTQPNIQSIKFYKHLITVTSDDQSFVVHIDVVEYEVPNVYLNQKPNTQTSTQVGNREDKLFRINEQGLKVPRNYLEYDYIFSGKNIDVLSFDIKIENLNFLLVQGNKLGAAETNAAAVSADKQEDGQAEAQETKTVGLMKPNDPLLMPQITNDQLDNFSKYSSTARSQGDRTPQEVSQEYMRNLSAFYNAGPYTAKMELRGNPDLMAGVVLQRLPQHIRSITIGTDGSAQTNTSGEAKQKYRQELEKTLGLSDGVYRVTGPLSGPSYISSPVFAKVNIFGPNVDFLTSAPIAGQNFTQQLFVDNFYFLSKIVTKIDGVKFTHDVDLMSYSVYGATSTTAKGVQAGQKPKVIQ